VVGFDPFVNLVDHLERRGQTSKLSGQKERRTAAESVGVNSISSVAEVAPV
jgi:hypothetical protein